MKSIDTTLIGIALLLNRLALGLLFLLAGVRKLLPSEEASIIDKWNGFASYVASQAPLPEALGKAYGYALPPVEFLAGAMLMLGLFSRISAAVIGLMLISFVIAMGPEWWPAQGPAFSKNFILITLALLIVCTGSGKFAARPDGPLK